MKATLLYWHKARLHGRYVLEMEIHRVEGPHIHVHERQFPYRYVDEETLIRDFKDMVRKILGVKL